MSERACEGPALTVAELHALLSAELAAGRGDNKLLVEGPTTLFEVGGFVAEPQRCWLRTSWCFTQPK